MKRRLLYLCALLSALAVSSCTGNDDNLSDSFDEGIVLTFSTGGGRSADVRVKGTPTPGDDDYNENLLNSVYYFFYPKGETLVEPSVSGYKTGLTETGVYTVRIPVSAPVVVNDLFASENECHLFAVANPAPDMVSTLEGKPTLAQLRSLTVLSSLTSVPQKNFVMVYDGPLSASSLTEKIAVDDTVAVKHLAAKFTIGAYVIDTLRQGEAVYTPEGVSVSFCNGVNRSTLCGWVKDSVRVDDYFKTDMVSLGTPTDTVTIDEGTTGAPLEKTYYEFRLSSPFYSYPMEWEFNSTTEPYLMYEVNWKITEGGDPFWKSLYYKMTLGRRAVMQNEWYDISGKLTILGSLSPEEPSEIYYYMDYLVQGWKDAYQIDSPNTPAVIKDTRYLAVSQSSWTLNNKNSVTIPFSSSHPCQVVGSSIRTSSYENGTENSNAEPSSKTVYYDLSQPNEITVTHSINNTLGTTMDCAPIIIEFDLQHTDNPTFSEHIEITQNPAIVIKTEPNSTGTQNRGSGANRGTNFGYTYVNAYTSTSGELNSTDWREVYGAASSGNNTSTYFTLIKVSQFESDYIVGDPRTVGYDNLDTGESSDPNTDGIHWTGYAPRAKGTASTNLIAASVRYDNTRNTIKYYHPTIDDTSRDNYVSPYFRVSSAHCRRYGNDSYQGSKQRCASYQEDGYPAGRWRLPTLAECKLMVTLSSTGKIPDIFIDDGSGKYHYAGGYFTVSGNTGDYREGNKTTTAAARCVYDEWYWSQVDAQMGWDNSVKTTFTWGDVPDDFVIPTPEP